MNCHCAKFRHYSISFIVIVVGLCCVKCKWEGKYKDHNAVDLGESREALKASLEDCVVKLESYRSALPGGRGARPAELLCDGKSSRSTGGGRREQYDEIAEGNVMTRERQQGQKRLYSRG